MLKPILVWVQLHETMKLLNKMVADNFYSWLLSCFQLSVFQFSILFAFIDCLTLKIPFLSY